MLNGFNIIFTGVTEETKNKLMQDLNLLEEFYKITPSFNNHLNKALEAKCNNIEFIGEDIVSGNYKSVQEFNACYQKHANGTETKIVIKAEQDTFDILKSILFELANATNPDLKHAFSRKFVSDEEKYADMIEKAEFKSEINSNQVMLEALKFLMEIPLVKKVIPSEHFDTLILTYEEAVNTTFEEYTQRPGYIIHKNSYVEEMNDPIMQDMRLEKLIDLKDITKIKSLLNKTSKVKKERFEQVFNKELNNDSIEIAKALLNHSSIKDSLQYYLFTTALSMNESQIEVLYSALDQTIEAVDNISDKKLFSIENDKLTKIIYKYPSYILNNEAFFYALKNKDEEFIKLIFDNIKIKFSGQALDLICNLNNKDILDKYLYQLDEIDIYICATSFVKLWQKWDKSILIKVLENPKNIANETYLSLVLDNCPSEVIDTVLKRCTNKEAMEKLFEKALKHGHLKYIEILTKYIPQKSKYLEIANNLNDVEIIKIVSEHLKAPLFDVELHETTLTGE